jgi:hypothetical protein
MAGAMGISGGGALQPARRGWLWPAGRLSRRPAPPGTGATGRPPVPKPLHTCTRRLKGKSRKIVMPSTMWTWKCQSRCRPPAGVGVQGDDALQVAGQRSMVVRLRPHGAATTAAWTGRGQLHPQDHQDGDVGAVAGQADARVGDAAVQQHGQADEAQAPGDAAGDDRHQLLLRRGDEVLIQPVRRQLPEQVAEEQEQDAAVEQVAAPAQLPDLRSSCELSLFQVYWSRSKRARLPMKNTARQM